jgi:putative DNA primase/helicase
MTNTDKDKFTAIAHDDDFRNGYASRTTWAKILEPHGWVLLSSDETRGESWEPPGRSGRQTSGAARTNEHGSLTVFTTSTEFEALKQYSKFDAYAVRCGRGRA